MATCQFMENLDIYACGTFYYFYSSVSSDMI